MHQALNPRLFYDATTGRLLRAFNDIRTEELANVFQTSPGSNGREETVEDRLRGRNDGDGYLAGDLIDARNCIAQGETIEVGPFEVEICSEIHEAEADENGDFLYEPEFDEEEDLFAEAHMYYHAAEIYEYFQDIGLDTVDEVPLRASVNFRVPAVISGGALDELVPFDNAFFFPAGDIAGIYNREFDSIVFGQGNNVDFAYDGDVIYHEFGHAVFQALSDPGSFTLDEQGLSAAPGALNEGMADFFAGDFGDDGEIGEYVGPRIAPAAGPSRNIRNMDNGHSCPGAIQGEVHADSTHFTGALWQIRLAYEDELGGDLEDFAAASLNAVTQFMSTITFDQASAILQSELEDIDPELTELIEEAWEDHATQDCERVVDLGGVFRQEDITFIQGPDTIGLDPWVPGFVQFRVRIDEDDLPANTIVLSYQYQGGGGFSSPARVEFVVAHEPIRLEYSGTQVTGNWTELVAVTGTSATARQATYQVPDGLGVGEVYFLPVSSSGGQGVLVGVQANIRMQDIPEPEPDPEPVADPIPDLAAEVELDAGAGGTDLVADGFADTVEESILTGEDSNGCDCRVGGSNRTPSGLSVPFILGLIGILLERSRLSV